MHSHKIRTVSFSDNLGAGFTHVSSAFFIHRLWHDNFTNYLAQHFEYSASGENDQGAAVCNYKLHDVSNSSS